MFAALEWYKNLIFPGFGRILSLAENGRRIEKSRI